MNDEHGIGEHARRMVAASQKRGGMEPIPAHEKPCNSQEHSPPTHLCIPAGMQYRHICPACGAEYVMCGSEVSFHV